jgi:hypothetical protein
MTASEPHSNGGVPFLRLNKFRVIFFSALLIIPCVWHRRIEAGDLPSHVYNAWLAQLIERGQAPGLFLAKQWNNVLFDFTLLKVTNHLGFPAAQKIVVSAWVLIFFWGVFSLIAAVTQRPPWFLAPCIAMLAYGYSFNMGFLNYYLSIGLACFALSLFWGPRDPRWIAGTLLLPFVLFAHPIGFLWFVAMLAYVKVREVLPGWWKLLLPLAALGSLLGLHRFVVKHAAKLMADWDRGPFFFYSGADQLALYGRRYFFLAAAVFFFGFICVAFDGYARRRDLASWKLFQLPFELYVVAFCATSLLPENLRLSLYSGWIGLLGSRLTTISAIFGLCFLGFLKPRKWHVVGFVACAVTYFGFLYQDTEWLNRLEANAESLVNGLPSGTRVIASVEAPADSRVTFIGHVVDRSCIGHCFSYGNYEPASREFRVRVNQGSRIVTASSDDSEDMASGEYEVGEDDLPLKQIYQCDGSDLTKLCIRDLVAGKKYGRQEFEPPEPR